MSRVGADTAQMHATVVALRQGGTAVQEAFQQAAQAMQAMQGSRWSGQHRVQAEEFWNRIQTQFGPTIEGLNDLAVRIERVANALDEAGRVFGGAGAPMQSMSTDNTGGSTVSGGRYQDVLKQYDGSHFVPESNKRPWVPIDVPVQSHTGERDPNLYAAVINQFGVESNPRYAQNQQGKGETYCNIFVWDATRAMGAEIPHWVDKNGNPGSPGNGNRELDANGTIRWMQVHGEQQGWKAVDATTAQAMANQGQPVVATMHNPGGIGHVAMVRPGEYADGQGPAIAQSGGRNMNDSHVKDGFGNLERVVYYVHE